MNLALNIPLMFSVKKIKKNIILIICARCSSKRFPNKVLKKINGVPLILQVYERVKNAKHIDKIIVATSNRKSDDQLKKLCIEKNIECFRGSLNDVFSRFVNIIKIYKADIVIRISADSPFIDPNLIDKSLRIFLSKKRLDIVTNILKRTYPKGQSIEVFNKNVFLSSKLKLTDYEREHVSPYFYNNKKKYKIFNFYIKNDLSKYNLTIDFKDDLIFFNKMIKKIEYNKINFSYRNILKFIKKNEN